MVDGISAHHTHTYRKTTKLSAICELAHMFICSARLSTTMQRQRKHIYGAHVVLKQRARELRVCGASGERYIKDGDTFISVVE